MARSSVTALHEQRWFAGVLAWLILTMLAAVLVQQSAIRRIPATADASGTVLAATLPSTVRSESRVVMYGGLASTMSDDVVMRVRVCPVTSNLPCVLDRQMELTPEEDFWGWIGAVPPWAAQGLYEGQLFLVERLSGQRSRTLWHHIWTIDVD